MPIPTGCDQLDRMLNGGLPEQRAVLVTGGPGVGKSTFAMQFLQEGLSNGEECLYVSTEQTSEELRSSFAPYAFDLDDPNLTITSIHATPEDTLEDSESGMALGTLDGDGVVDGTFSYPFEGEYIMEYLEEFGPCDRVVLDSASGLEVVSETENRFRRMILDFIRLFTDTFEATTVFTAEDVAPTNQGVSIGTSDLLQFSTNGVIRLWWETLQGDRRRFLQVVKMRGVDHDTRNYEVGFAEDGLFLTPAGRNSGSGVRDDAVISTRIDGMDELCGGLVRGHSVLLEYDGRALIDNMVANMIHAAFSAEMAVWLIPSPILSTQRFEDLLPGPWDVERMLDDDRLFVLDGFSAWQRHHDHRNVFSAPSGIIGNVFRRSSNISIYLMKQMAKRVGKRRDRPLLGTTYTEAFLRWLDPPEVKEVYYWAREMLAEEYDTGFFIHNPATMQDELAEFFHSDAVQVFETTMEQNGIQYLQLNKSPIGHSGSMGVVDFSNDRISVETGGLGTDARDVRPSELANGETPDPEPSRNSSPAPNPNHDR